MCFPSVSKPLRVGQPVSTTENLKRKVWSNTVWRRLLSHNHLNFKWNTLEKSCWEKPGWSTLPSVRTEGQLSTVAAVTQERVLSSFTLRRMATCLEKSWKWSCRLITVNVKRQLSRSESQSPMKSLWEVKASLHNPSSMCSANWLQLFPLKHREW